MYSNEPYELSFNTQYSITRLIYLLLGTKLGKRDIYPVSTKHTQKLHV